jgi:hypothetical protein
MFKQFNSLGTEKIIPDNTDIIPIQQADGVTRHIKRENFLGSSSNSNPILNTILYRDANWNLATRVNQYVARETLLWTSFGVDGSGADSLIGTLKIGYLKLKSKLHICLAGGGATSPTLKTFKLVRKTDNSVLLSLNLGQVLGVDSNTLIHKEINTLSIAGEEIYFHLEDNATDAYGWMAFSPNIFIE